MRIYRLAFDPNYRSLRFADSSLYSDPTYQFDSTPRAAAWITPEVVSPDESKPAPNFWRIEGLPQAFVASAQPAIYDPRVLLASCEQLPVKYGDETLYLHNVTNCTDSLDIQNCTWPSGQLGVGLPSKYAFYSRFT